MLMRGSLVGLKDTVGKRALHNAAKNGLVAVMEALAAKGADLNASTKVHAPLRSLLPGGKERRS